MRPTRMKPKYYRLDGKPEHRQQFSVVLRLLLTEIDCVKLCKTAVAGCELLGQRSTASFVGYMLWEMLQAMLHPSTVCADPNTQLQTRSIMHVTSFS